MKKTVIGVSFSLMIIALTGCGSPSGASTESAAPVETTSTEMTEQLEQNIEIKSNTDGYTESTEERENTDENSNKTEGEVEVSTSRNRIDSDIMERYAMQMTNLSDENFIYDENGNLVEVSVTSQFDGSVKKYYEFEYDLNDRVKTIYEYGSSGNQIFMKSTFTRNSDGQKTEVYNEISDGNGGLKPASRIVTEYDSEGRRVFDYPYTAEGERQETYNAYVYDEGGNRTKYQNIYSSNDEVGSEEIYEYDANGNIICAYYYTGGTMSYYKEYVYEDEGFDYMMLYEGGEGSGVKGYDFLLPGNLYEMQVY